MLRIVKNCHKWTKKGNAVLLIFIMLFFVQSGLLYAKEISVLPASVTGNIPLYLGTKEDASKEIAKLTRHYLKRNYQTELTDSNSIEKFLINENYREDTKVNEASLNLLCLEWESNFVTKDSVDFGSPIIIQTEIYNCKNKSLQTIHSKIVSNFILAIEKHVEKSFRFLSPKFYEKNNKNQISYQEIHFLYDTNGSYSYYRKDFQKVLNGILDNSNLFIGATFIRKDKIVTLPPSLEHTEVKKLFEDVSWSGSNRSDSVLQAIQSLRLKFTSGKKTSRKLFLILSGAVREKSTDITLALNELRQLGIELYIIIPNHSELNVIRELQKIGRKSSSKLIGITEYQKIGTEDGYTQIFLNQFNLYSTTMEISPPFQLDSQVFKKWDASQVRAAVDTVTPYNMSEAFEKLSEKRVLEKEEVKTDIESSVGNEIISDASESERFQTVLLKTKGEAIWLKISNEINVTIGKEYLIQTTVTLDPFSTYGITNLANETEFLKTSTVYPKTLHVTPSKAKKFLEDNKIRQFSGYLQGVISLVKKK
ncbi:MAG: hypothetical protein SH817_03180 [Leptospira sp.]|nr:hypothetical protein [Leptospira sp.]